MNLLPERTLGEFSHYRILFTDSNVRLKLFSTRHGSLWELKVLYGRETLKHEVKSLSLDGIFIMHSFQERFVYSSLRKMGSCQPRLGRKSYSVVVQFYPWFKFCFPLFYPKQRKRKFKPRIGLNHNIYIWYWNVSCNVRQNMRRILSW